MWFLILLVMIIFLIIDVARNNFGNFKRVLPIDVPLLQRDPIFMLDVNTEKDFEFGHIAGSINIPSKSFSIDDKSFKAKKNQAVLVIDQSGLTANPIAKKLADNGYEKVFVLAGGIAAWQKENFPLA
jgi:rhodanese-related sulfurtransferase